MMNMVPLLHFSCCMGPISEHIYGAVVTEIATAFHRIHTTQRFPDPIPRKTTSSASTQHDLH